MSFRDILAILISDADEAAVRCAQSLAQKQGGKASALLFELEPSPIYAPGISYGYVDGVVWAQIVDQAHEAFLSVEGKIKTTLAALPQPMPLEVQSVFPTFIGTRAALQARYADLAIMARPSSDQRGARNEMFEGVLFGSGRPVILTPSNWPDAPIGKTIALGWNAKREAARALSAASPLIDLADKVVVLTVDAEPSWKGHGEAPGADIAAHLARRGVNAEVVNISSGVQTEAEALLAECSAIGADLLVIGGYGHSRLEEFVLGGVTRALIREAPIPLFMAH